MNNISELKIDDSNSPTSQPEKVSILLVDDEKNILMSLKRLFRPMNFNVILSTSGEEALAILEREPVNLIISDMRMPNMDGSVFLTKVAKKWPQIIRILLTGYSDLSSTVAAVNNAGIYKYINKPWDDLDVTLTVTRALEQQDLEKEKQRLVELTKKQNEELTRLNDNLEKTVNSRTEEVRQTMGMLEKTHGTLKESYATTIKVFSNLIEMRKGRYSSYTTQIASTARKISEDLGASNDETQSVMYASLLRNIGKIILSDNILNKPSNSLSAEECKRMERHPVIGEGILLSLNPLLSAASIIRAQHERWDGKGFPDRLKGKGIPLGARILAIVSDYYGLQSGSISTQKLSSYEAIEYIKRNRSVRYDPELVDIFVNKLDIMKNDDGHVLCHLIKSNGIKAGMVLAKDLCTKEGLLVLSEGYMLDDNLIKKIQKFEMSLNEDLDIYVAKRK